METRQIKFKAKRLDNGKWVEGDLLHTENLAFITWFDNGFRKLEKVAPSTICQFTGLTDCEGNEVWEGDIIGNHDFPFERRTVTWANCLSCFIPIDEDGGQDRHLSLLVLFKKWTVVGNKFDKEKWLMKTKMVLTLTVSKQWFDMIVAGEKNEEYREIKPYWIKRLTTNCEVAFDVAAETYCGKVLYRPYTHVLFINGYRKDAPRIEKEIDSISIGKPKRGLCPDKWLDKEFFIIKFK